MEPRQVIIAFDQYLQQQGLRLQAVVIGGTALNLLGVLSRPTRDCDILDPPLTLRIPAPADRQFHG